MKIKAKITEAVDNRLQNEAGQIYLTKETEIEIDNEVLADAIRKLIDEEWLIIPKY